MNEERIYSFLTRLISKDFKLLIRAFLLFFILFVFISFLIPKRYQSTLKVLPNQNENNISSLNFLAQDFGLSGSSPSNFPLSEIALSNSVLDKIYYSNFETSSGSITNLENILNQSFFSFSNQQKNESLQKYLTIEKFKERLNVSYDRRTNITTLSVQLEDPFISKQVLDLFYNELSSFINNSINNAASYKKNFIEKRISVVQNELLSAESSLEEFLNINRFFQDSPLLLKKYNELKREVSVKEGAYLILKQELEVAKIDEIKNTLKIFIIESPQVSPVKSYPSRLPFSLTSSVVLLLIFFIIRNRFELKKLLIFINKNN